MLGDEYISQHIFQAMESERLERGYRIYMSDALYALAGGPHTFSSRWADLEPVWSLPHPEEDPDAVKDRILSKLNGEEEPNEPI